LDQCHRDYPPWQKAAVLAQSSDFDADGDGVQDTLDDLARKWVVGRVMMTSRLRSALGGSAILLANSGGPLVDASLNGITIEGVGSQWTVVQARSFLQAERAVARTPFFGAGWVLTEECDAPTRNLARLVPGCFYGRMTGEYP
jgi:hypothetical protein